MVDPGGGLSNLGESLYLLEQARKLRYIFKKQKSVYSNLACCRRLTSHSNHSNISSPFGHTPKKGSHSYNYLYIHPPKAAPVTTNQPLLMWLIRYPWKSNLPSAGTSIKFISKGGGRKFLKLNSFLTLLDLEEGGRTRA